MFRHTLGNKKREAKSMHCKVVLENFEMFGNVMRHCSQCLIYPCKSNRISPSNIVVKIGAEGLNRNAICRLSNLCTESTNLPHYCNTFFTDYLDSKFHPWLTRSRNELQPKEDGRHLPVHDQPNHTTNKSNLFFYFACLF